MSLPSLTDFPDRLSPMLVKELRQGLRAKTFVAVFLTLQVAMALILFSSTAAAISSNRAGGVISSIIFIFFAIAALVIQPLRGIGAISSEVKGNTIDMMVLTRLDARRIVYGKWFAIVSQTALLFATIVPYLIFRYFFGGMNLLGEVVVLLLIFITSVALTAVTVGLSSCQSVILRALIPILGLPVMAIALLGYLISGSYRGMNFIDMCTLAEPNARIIVGCYLAGITYLSWSLLSLGASLIAPAAENHSTSRRLISLGLAIAAVACTTLSGFDPPYLLLMFAVIAFPAILIALTEPPVSVPHLHDDSFLGRTGIGRMLAWLLAPGWPSGVLFALLMGTLFMLPLAEFFPHSAALRDETQVVLITFFATSIFPALILIPCRVQGSARLSVYLFILIGSMLFAWVMAAIAEALGNHDLLWLFIWDPFVMLPMLDRFHSSSSGPLLAAAIVVTALYSAILVCFAIVGNRRQVETVKLSTHG